VGEGGGCGERSKAGKTVNQGIAFGEQGADVTENGRKELSNEK